MQFESHLGHSVSAGQGLFVFLLLTKLDIFQISVLAPFDELPYRPRGAEQVHEAAGLDAVCPSGAG
jgi:hypothetical protein